MANEISTIGAKLSYKKGAGTTTDVKNLETYPDLGTGVPSKIEVTNLSDSSQRFIDGIKEVPDTLEFGCIYEKGATGNFAVLQTLEGDETLEWTFTIDKLSIKFNGTCTVTLTGTGVNDAVRFTLGITPTSAITMTTSA